MLLPDKPIDKDGCPFPERVVFTDDKPLNFAAGVHTKTNKVAEAGMAKDSESMLMIDSSELQHEQEHAQYKTPQKGLPQDDRPESTEPRQNMLQEESKA